MDIYLFKHYVKAFRSFPSKYFRSEIRLIEEKTFKPKKYEHRFVDIFMSDIFMSDDFDNVIIELKLFNLVGLLCGEFNKWNKNPPYEDLIDLDSKLKHESEEKLLHVLK